MSVPSGQPPSRHTRRVPDSIFFNWIVPALFVLFALLMIVIVIFSVGVMTGIIHYL